MWQEKSSIYLPFWICTMVKSSLMKHPEDLYSKWSVICSRKHGPSSTQKIDLCCIQTKAGNIKCLLTNEHWSNARLCRACHAKGTAWITRRWKASLVY